MSPLPVREIQHVEFCDARRGRRRGAGVASAQAGAGVGAAQASARRRRRRGAGVGAASCLEARGRQRFFGLGRRFFYGLAAFLRAMFAFV